MNQENIEYFNQFPPSFWNSLSLELLKQDEDSEKKRKSIELLDVVYSEKKKKKSIKLLDEMYKKEHIKMKIEEENLDKLLNIIIKTQPNELKFNSAFLEINAYLSEENRKYIIKIDEQDEKAMLEEYSHLDCFLNFDNVYPIN